MAFFSQRTPNPQPTGQPPSARPRLLTLKWVLWFVVVAVIGVVAWIGISGAIAIKNIVATNNNDGAPAAVLHASLKPTDVQTEGDSRVNILLAGIGGPGHSGPDLSDTLEVYSIDPVNKTAAILSIPRDLYVPLPDGSHGRINVVNTLGSTYCRKTVCAAGVDQGGAAMEGAIGQLLGININYFVRINFSGFQQLVDSLNGIDLTVPTELRDPLYPCPDPSTAYCPIDIKAGVHHFDGVTALKYARSRETTSDFARAARQQLVIAAIRQKAQTAGVLANPAKITQVLNLLGRNARTDIQPSELSTLVGLLQGLNNSQTVTTVLDTSATGPLTSAVIGGADVLVPRLGLNDFTGVKLFVDAALKDPYILKEQATIAIVNASGKAATGLAVETQLKALGYNVISLTEGQTQLISTVTNAKAKPYTASLLQKRFAGSFVSATISQTTDIVVTVGSRYSTK
ncbi:MAG TPA: LCP family protein [Candidatus Saccharimonadales bacterium]|nr:LCP family protein [Candidatus Saccharimonadales bacterium]